MIASPCTKVCVMDAEQRYCLGCGRSLDEIARWAQMSDADVQKAVDAVISETGAAGPKDMGKVMAALKARLAGRADMGAVSALVKSKLSG